MSTRRCKFFSILILGAFSIQTVHTVQRWPGDQDDHSARTSHALRRDELGQNRADIIAMLSNMTPSTIRKMTGEPGEMFFLDYYSFDDSEAYLSQSNEDATQTSSLPYLSSVYQPPLLPHSNESENLLPRWLPMGLRKRAFECPAGTSSCANIGKPDSCCAQGLTCDLVKDTGLGSVGCCTEGTDCSGQVAGCPSGYATCSDEQGGGCCIPGYACNGAGCVQTSTTTVQIEQTVTAGLSTSLACSSGFHSCPASLFGGCCPSSEGMKRAVMSPRSPSLPNSPTHNFNAYDLVSPATSSSTCPDELNSLSTSTTLFDAYEASSPLSSSFSPSNLPCDPHALDCGRPAPETSTVLVTVAPSSSSSWSLTLIEPPGTVLLTSYTTVCGTSSLCLSTSTTTVVPTTTDTPAAPVRPTSGSSSAAAASTTAAAQVSGPCPSNYYACSAYYPGAGCCQIGRDCSSTSCPPRQTSTQLVSNGVTVVVAPTGGTIATMGGGGASPTTAAQDSCPGGWQTCASSIGGGCCPDNYACGTASCTLTGTAATAPAAAISATIAKDSKAGRLDTYEALARGFASGVCVVLIYAW